ncbi:hypothetical protein [Pseudomonas sp. Irchel s3f19]|uniref:hypothetical protein n=1 Tax=Pseudomonas sp. Irchel s3f19 TaxID=2009146 RepID=UPI001C44288C|nr:hypothetical protein [Pseudomonas sp. Irchel s3f19]
MKRTIIYLILMVVIKEGDSTLSTQLQRIDIIHKISDILAGNAKRDDVSEWAFNIFDDDSLRLEDPVVLKYLKLLGAVDLPSSDRDFLYTDDDLRHWITEIESQ